MIGFHIASRFVQIRAPGRSTERSSSLRCRSGKLFIGNLDRLSTRYADHVSSFFSNQRLCNRGSHPHCCRTREHNCRSVLASVGADGQKEQGITFISRIKSCHPSLLEERCNRSTSRSDRNHERWLVPITKSPPRKRSPRHDSYEYDRC